MRILAPGGIGFDAEMNVVDKIRRKFGYVVADIQGEDIIQFGKRVFLLCPHSAYIRVGLEENMSHIIYRFNDIRDDGILLLYLSVAEIKYLDIL